MTESEYLEKLIERAGILSAAIDALSRAKLRRYEAADEAVQLSDAGRGVSDQAATLHGAALIVKEAARALEDARADHHATA